MKLFQGIIITLMSFFIAQAFADSRHLAGFGGVAQNMMDPVGLFSDFVYTGCIIIGTSFLFASVVKYMEHRRSPLMVPISTVVFLFIAGAVLLLLPFLSYFTSYGTRYSLFR
jgi:hypothetical protein